MMNIEVLEFLMKERNIKSYYRLAKEANFPYTTLLDLVNGRSTNLNNIKRLATFFGAEYQMLLADTNYCYLVNEKNEVKSFLPLDILERSNTFATVLLGNY